MTDPKWLPLAMVDVFQIDLIRPCVATEKRRLSAISKPFAFFGMVAV
jgi:hypothetical protein